MSSEVVVVIGMHRSGTSAIARALNVLGVELGHRLIAPGPDNETGFWEDADIVNIHDRLLEVFGCSWDSLSVISPNAWMTHAVKALRDEATVLVRERFGHCRLWGFKDPRTARLLPFWRPIFADLGLAPKYVIVVRNPLNVAESLRARDRKNFTKATLLWLEHYVEAVTQSVGAPRMLCHYDQFVEDPRAGIARLQQFLGRSSEAAPLHAIEEYVSGFLKEELRHHRYEDTHLDSSPDMPALVSKVYAAIREALRQDRPSVSDALQRECEAVSSTLAELAPLLRAVQADDVANASRIADLSSQLWLISGRWLNAGRMRVEIQGQLRRVEDDQGAVVRELTAMRESRSWRLTAPLRTLCNSVGRKGLRGLGVLAKALLGGPSSGQGGSHFDPSLRAIQQLRMHPSPVSRPPRNRPYDPHPEITLSAVSFNNGRWIEGFVESLITQAYPLSRVTLIAVDNASTDGTLETWRKARDQYGTRFARFELHSRPNLGFGAGHNFALKHVTTHYVLITNIDLQFERDTLARVVSAAIHDDEDVAAWEPRQAPYEHPKYYDPATLETTWNSGACTLYRTELLRALSGYDERIFLYGEDVELSYRLRGRGYRLRVCPGAVVWHFTYRHASEVKPAQFLGSIRAHAFLRMRYGTLGEVRQLPRMIGRLMKERPVIPDQRRQLIKAAADIVAAAPHFLLSRPRTTAAMPFSDWDYHLRRDGAFIPVERLPAGPLPKVSVIVHTTGIDPARLAETLASVWNQTWPNIELLLVDDGGSVRHKLDDWAPRAGLELRYLPIEKSGRVGAGNRGLEAATGDFIQFLNDPDMLFADHIEILAGALLKAPNAPAAYALAWEVLHGIDQASPLGYTETGYWTPTDLRQPFDRETLWHHNFMPIQAVLFRREVYQRRGGLNPKLDLLADWDMWLRYSLDGEFIFVAKTTSLFRTPLDPVERQALNDTLAAGLPRVLEEFAHALGEHELAVAGSGKF